MTYQEALSYGKKQLGTNHNEASILLGFVLQCSYAKLLAWPEKNLSSHEKQQFLSLIEKRLQGYPIAYLLGYKAFWTFDKLKVNQAVLIPRPETEILVEHSLALAKTIEPIKNIADLGTGSGVIALALGQENPHWQITAIDISEQALAIAQYNAETYHINNILFQQGSWCSALDNKITYQMIISNPPYIAQDDLHLQQGDLRFEPLSALAAANQGLDAINQIVQNAKTYLQGYLVLEHGYNQALAVRELMQNAGYQSIQTIKDYSQHDRVTSGYYYG